uniref:Uncharacterized protein n=1 Tax=Amphora coffeiformis TaxID=265554 RepID=A0A7S3PBH6_9STRA|mmetsp:Transcript_23199/g.44186  ORF Transcript_23199/g.44186 Transcript_23199/m.44186 type:complete len:137 (-) Transcript_23199:76-486(-)|eukprot:scaffold3846_cov108-Amphora_coffeaeformis.AAC.1
MPTNHCMFAGCICCYTAVNLENIVCCCQGSNECLCLVSEHCLAVNAQPLGLGLVTNKSNGEFCKLGLFCCTLGLKMPSVLCAGATQILCCEDVQSFPFDSDYVNKPVCAYLCVQCLPECGIAKPPPSCPALNKMVR